MADVYFAADTQFSHAYIVSVSDEAGNVRLAERAAAAVLCTGTGIKPCGQCRNCRKVMAGTHPDVAYIEREKNESGSLRKELSVGQIRRMSADAYIMPYEAEKKVYIIREAELMNISAQNAALKLFEEPPRYACFFLCTPNPGALLITVRSRCADIRSIMKGRPERESGEETDEELSKKVGEYIKAAASGNALKLLEWSAANEGLNNAAAGELLEAIKYRLTDMLAEGTRVQGLSPQHMFRLTELMSRCRGYLDVNTGVKHIFGLLAVESLPESRGNGETN